MVWLECLRCHHRWVQRVEVVRTCPRCRSVYWNVPRKAVERGRPPKARVSDKSVEADR